MILQQLKAYLEEHGTSERKVLANHFGLSEDGVDAMLQRWIDKGQVMRIEDTIKGKFSGVRYALNKGIGISVKM
ncbi:ferrous iron transport protein C [Vibrio ishigakensis]|uniref:Ferrous iron transport protein C n=1 Tax=Vibrio ishigakensis TaxID=1481914 RepID=A0A0B8NLK9_9VIBR|nr:FeoC-like transcriptional regulator [Vibrio ishigakensis]GAM55595.1 ferrous iron transport protein C [Vibrio ishigakensis]GAM73190.1 ferrous iron transport protein C [Vibrio ishigakensis]